MTQCTPTLFDFQPLGSREVVAAFNGGKITTDAGGLLLREVESKFGFITQFASCFTDFRDADAMHATMGKYFGDWRPASTTVCINQLSSPGARVELDMIVALPKKAT